MKTPSKFNIVDLLRLLGQEQLERFDRQTTDVWVRSSSGKVHLYTEDTLKDALKIDPNLKKLYVN